MILVRTVAILVRITMNQINKNRMRGSNIMKESKGESAPLHWPLGYIYKKVEAVKILNQKIILVMCGL